VHESKRLSYFQQKELYKVILKKTGLSFNLFGCLVFELFEKKEIIVFSGKRIVASIN